MRAQYCLLFALLSIGTIDGAKILIYPIDAGFNSRIMNLIKMADILNEAGHNATVITNDKILPRLKPERTNLTVYNLPNADKVKLITDEDVLQRFKDISFFEIVDFLNFFIDMGMPFCRSVVGTGLLQRLKAEQYDLIIIDAMSDCGRIVVDYLDIPAMTYSNWGFIFDAQTFYPYVPSFVCAAGLTACYSDEMDFKERLGNVIQAVMSWTYIYPILVDRYDALKSELGLNVSRSIAQSQAYRAPVLVNGDFVLDYPRPLMPHIIMIRGLYYKKPKPLPQDLAEFIEGSAPHGVVVVSFGSLVPKVSSEKAEIMARVFGQLNQRVLWRFTGDVPKALKNNTKLVGWFPQADVLAHPLTTMFITHAGISGTYEAALNGLPVVATPMFADQEYNARKMVGRGGMGVKIDLDNFSEREFEEAVTAAITNSTYRHNAKRVSSLLKDQEMDPKQKLLYWVDYVIRHNGAKHLISETALSMNSFVYHSIDVFLFLLAIIIIILTLLILALYGLVSIARNYFSRKKEKTQ